MIFLRAECALTQNLFETKAPHKHIQNVISDVYNNKSPVSGGYISQTLLNIRLNYYLKTFADILINPGNAPNKQGHTKFRVITCEGPGVFMHSKRTTLEY